MITEITEQTITGKIGQLSVPSRLGVKTTLGPMMDLLERLGRPERAFPSIHVGGTSGKGSTSSFLANILCSAGYQTGLFTKPHLHTVRERLVIDREPISPEAMLLLLERMPNGLKAPPTWFELVTALAFQHFADQQVDFGVIEVGLGGTLDATNVIFPELSVLTNVGLDHTDVLGSTVEEIAADKAGIIKPGKPVVSGAHQPSVRKIIRDRCARLGSPLIVMGEDFHYTVVALEAGGSVFDFEMGSRVLRDLSVVMPGQHQIANAAVAIAAALALRKAGYAISNEAIYNGIMQTRVPGRLEVLGNAPAVLLDGAHSPPKMVALADSLRQLFSDKKHITGVLAFSKGHDAEDSLRSLIPLLDAAVVTEFTAETDYGNKRAQDAQEIANILLKHNPTLPVMYIPDPEEAIQAALHMAGPDDLVCVTGSIFLVGQVREILTSIHGEDYVPNPA